MINLKKIIETGGGKMLYGDDLAYPNIRWVSILSIGIIRAECIPTSIIVTIAKATRRSKITKDASFKYLCVWTSIDYLCWGTIYYRSTNLRSDNQYSSCLWRILQNVLLAISASCEIVLGRSCTFGAKHYHFGQLSATKSNLIIVLSS